MLASIPEPRSIPHSRRLRGWPPKHILNNLTP